LNKGKEPGGSDIRFTRLFFVKEKKQIAGGYKRD